MLMTIQRVTARHVHVTLVLLLVTTTTAPPGDGSAAADADADAAATWPPFCPEPCVCGFRKSSSSPAPLRTVECSGSGLRSPPSNVSADVEMFVLGSNRIRPDSLNALSVYGNLSEIDLSENHIYGLADVRIVLSSLACLVIDGNELDYLANKSFVWAPNLRRLSIRRNKIELIHGEAFVGLSELRSLDLSENRLFSVVPEWFRDLIRIERLVLARNNIHVIRNEAFRSAATLRSLDIGANQLQHLYDGAFVGLRSLRTIVLQGNNLNEFPGAALRQLPALREANLNANPIRTLDADSVSHLTVVRLLLSHLDRLEFVDRRSFANLSRLARLELHNNRILNYVDPEAFHGVPDLSEFYLQNDNLSVVQEAMLGGLPSLRVLDLAGNSLYCDCNMRWLIDEARDRKRNLSLPEVDSWSCSAPTALRGTALKEVDDTLVPASCAPRILPLYSLEYSIDLGDTLRLDCRAVGRPEPQTDWLLPDKRSDGRPSGGVLLLKTGSGRASGDRLVAGDHVTISPAGTLTVRYAGADSGGEYTCLASNPRGRDERTAHVDVNTDLADVIILGVTERSVTVTWRSRSYRHAYRILYRRKRDNDTYHAVDIEPYMRTFTANDLAPRTSYEFCIAMRQAARTVRIRCTLVRTRPNANRTSGLYDARRLVVGGAAGCLAVLLAIVCTATYYIRRYNRRKRAQEELYTDNLSQLFLASMDSMSDTTPITYENTGAEMFDDDDDDDDDDVDNIRVTGEMPGCSGGGGGGVIR